MTTTITYIDTATEHGSCLAARFDGPTPDRTEQRILLEREALNLLPRMRDDILRDPARWNGSEPESYRQFSALIFLAAEDDPERCPADYYDLWIKKDGAADGEEPDPGFYGRFEMNWQHIRIQITYQPVYFWICDHLDIKSIAPAREMLPITDTGYRLQFLSRADLIHAGGIQAFVTAWLDTNDIPEYQERRAASKQMSLF